MKIGKWRSRWYERRRLVPVPDGEVALQDQVFRVSSPDVIAIEETQDLRQSARQVLDGTPRRARLVRRRADYALYRIDEPVNGRTASGHWVYSGDDGLVLTAIALVPTCGFPVRRAR